IIYGRTTEGSLQRINAKERESYSVFCPDSCLFACIRGHSSRAKFFWQGLEPSARLGQLGVGLGKAEADQVLAAIAVVKSRTRHRSHSRLLEQVHGFVATCSAGKNRRVCQDIVGALGDGRSQPNLFE